jgi:hypothetical protein
MTIANTCNNFSYVILKVPHLIKITIVRQQKCFSGASPRPRSSASRKNKKHIANELKPRRANVFGSFFKKNNTISKSSSPQG